MTRIASLLLVAVLGCGGSSQPTKPTGPTGSKISAANTLSTAEEVIEASLAAQGGRELLGKVTSLKQTASIVVPQANLKGTISIFSAPPRNSLQTFEIAGIGKSMQGTHDDIAWEINPITGARILEGAEKRIALRDATFNADLRWKELYPKSELQGIVDYNGQQAYKVVLTAAEGDAVTRYFAKDTLLPLGFETVVQSQMGQMPVALVESDYRDVQGLKFPYKLQRKDSAVALEITVETIELSLPIDPKLFEIPQEIKALQGAKGPSSASSPPAAPGSR